jgi:hypothetical protein
MKTLFALLCLTTCGVHAQNVTIDWFTMDGGGGTSTGGVYTIQGTIGQPDAGLMSGGSYSLVGGFWSIASAIQTPGAPRLTVTRNPSTGAVTISWPKPAEGWLLDQTSALASPATSTSWSQVSPPYSTNATDVSITVPAPAGDRYYRLRK